jgi:DNA-binding NtrC family response regulator
MVKRVLFLDDDDDLREIVVQMLEDLGVACDAVATVEQMRATMARSGGAVDVAVLDVNLGGGHESGVDAYHWLRENGFSGRVAFLTGHGRTHPLVSEALRIGDATVRDKPITMRAFRELLE